MTTKTKTPDIPAAPISGPVAPGLNDTRGDEAPVLGHFVEITKGDDKGFFGVFVELQGETAVVRSHRNPNHRVSAPYADIKAASLHR
jgi:hypothetical protein